MYIRFQVGLIIGCGLLLDRQDDGGPAHAAGFAPLQSRGVIHGRDLAKRDRLAGQGVQAGLLAGAYYLC